MNDTAPVQITWNCMYGNIDSESDTGGRFPSRTSKTGEHDYLTHCTRARTAGGPRLRVISESDRSKRIQLVIVQAPRPSLGRLESWTAASCHVLQTESSLRVHRHPAPRAAPHDGRRYTHQLSEPAGLPACKFKLQGRPHTLAPLSNSMRLM